MAINAINAAPILPGRRVLALLAGLLAISIACWLGWRIDPHLTDENHAMENAQAVALLLAWLVHGWRASKMDRAGVAYTLHIGLSLLMYSFLLRELDISEIDGPGQQAWTWTEHILRGIGWTCWLLFVVHFVTRIGRIWALRWQLLATPVMVAALCGGLLMVAGWPFDKKKIDALPEATSEFIEELLELNAYIILLVSSVSSTLGEMQVYCHDEESHIA